jgi:putative Ca2+/H+ antiporter (TMEM165/GDT1 family)
MYHRTKPLSGSSYLQSIGAVLLLCALAAGFFFKGQSSAVVSMLAKSGFTAAFTLIFVSEIGDKVYNSFQMTATCLASRYTATCLFTFFPVT